MRDVTTTLFLFGNHAVTAAVVLGLFWAATARPSRIRKPALFRLSALLTGLSFVANVVVPLAVLVHAAEDDRGRSAGPRPVLYVLALPPVLVMLAIYLGVVSVMDGREQPQAEPAAAPPRGGSS